MPHLDTVALWPLHEFREWANEALGTIRELRRTFTEPGDLAWRASAAEIFEARGLDAPSRFAQLKARLASEYLTVVR